MENYKQLTEDLATGKNLLLDYNNNEIECTKYGLKKPKYSRNITGQSSFQNRFNKGLMKKIKYDPSQYLPGSNRLLGSPMFPRPISIPFYNQENNKEKSLLDEIRKEALYNVSKFTKPMLIIFMFGKCFFIESSDFPANNIVNSGIWFLTSLSACDAN